MMCPSGHSTSISRIFHSLLSGWERIFAPVSLIDLTIKGITRPVSIPFTFSKNGDEAQFAGSFELHRKDFNLERKGVGEIVKIELTIPVKK